MKEHLVVSLTTWKKRIGNIPAVLDTIFAQTVQPDAVVLNLSEEEFSLETIPTSVLDYIKAHSTIEVNWVKHDTRVWKKFLPTLKLYPESLILPIDDDILYPPTMIEDFMDVHAKYPDSPISGNHYSYKGLKCHCGCASLIQAKHMEGWKDFYKHAFRIACPSSDIFYSKLAANNGYFYVQTRSDYQKDAIAYNEMDGYSAAGVRNKLATSWKAFYDKAGYEAVRYFDEDDNRPYCILGAAQTERGKVIEAELAEWLKPFFNLIVIRHDGSTFEYTAIRYLKTLMTRLKKPCFYLHTKGAYFDRKVAPRVRRMWAHEFVENMEKYLATVDTSVPTVATPYTGKCKVTWYNGWCANASAIIAMNLIRTDDRFYYEHCLFSDIDVKGIRMDNIENHTRALMHKDLLDNFE